MRSDIELLRVVSAFGIVWFHSGYQYGGDLAYGGLIVFLILSTYFAGVSEKTHSIRARASRLLIPCVLWAVLYGALSIIRDQPLFPSDYSFVSKVLSTPSIHLWYLPFVFFWIIVIDNITKYIAPKKLAIVITIMVSILLLASPQWRQWSYASPFGQYMHAFPAILIGMLLASSHTLSRTLKICLISTVSVSMLYVFWANIQGVSLTYLVGISSTFILLKKKSFLPENNIIIKFSGLTFGIYLLHPLILFLLRHVGIGSIILPIMGFLISALCIFISSKIIPKPILKFIM